MAQQLRPNYHPVLPKQKDDGKVGNFNVAGEWVDRRASELEILSRSLKVEKIEFEVNSIPDMWARPLLFEMALFDEGHLLHERILGEWRGLLAMLALREYMGLDLNVRQVEIPQNSSGTRSRNKPAPFLAALSKLIPKKTLVPDTTWHNLQVLLFRRDPIGITSPTTLVCTATDYYGHITGLPWFDGQYLRDPITHLAGNYQRELAGWLSRLRGNLLQHPGYDPESGDWDRLMRLISEFIQDSGGAVQAGVDLSDTKLGLGSGLFAHLERPVRAEAPSPTESHVRLIPLRENAPRKSILVVDPDIADQWKMGKQEIFVWGGLTLAMMPFGGLSDQQNEIRGINLEDAEIWKPEKFLTEKLFVISQKDAFPGAVKVRMSQPGAAMRLRGEEVTPILPVNKQLLNYLKPEDISERLRFEQSNEGIVVKLRLPLAGPDGNGKDFEISREYSPEDKEVIELQNVPVLEVWPNFKVSDGSWKAYYTYYYAALEEGTFDAQPYALGNRDEQIQSFPYDQDESKRRITRMDIFPEAMVCAAKMANPRTDRMEIYEAGVMLIKQPPPVPPPVGPMKVGIDFGATNTHVYVKQGSNEPAPIAFKDRCVQITKSGPDRTNLYKDFLSGYEERPPFLSIFRDFQNPKDPNRLRALLDGRIYYLFNLSYLDVNSRGFAADLKWSNDEMDRLRTMAFLEQLCLQVAAEAVSKGVNQVAWAYSFPTAFSREMMASFSQIWELIIKGCAALTGLTRAEESLTAKTESVATAIFFREHPECHAPIALGTVCMDIGGSTTDIAIWQNNNLLWQASLRIAGRDMFSSPLYARPGFLKVFNVDVTKLVEEKGKGNLTSFHIMVDAMVKGLGKQWFDLLPTVGGKEEVKRFTQLIAIGLAGIFYYIGLVLKHLETTGTYQRQIPDVYVGGNAARLFHWLAGGSFSHVMPINDLFKRILLHSSGFGDLGKDFKIKISPDPKAEAAYGLVHETALKIEAKEEEEENVVIAGEVFLEDRVRCDWNEIVLPERLHNGLEVPDRLEYLQDFLTAFNRYTREVSPIEGVDVLVHDVRKRLADSLKEFTTYKEAKAVPVEPVFILALKNLLKIKIEDWASGGK